MLDVMILAVLAFPVASLLYHWAFYKPECAALRWLARRNAGKVYTLRPAPRKPPTKAETKAAIEAAARERYWRRRLAA